MTTQHQMFPVSLQRENDGAGNTRGEPPEGGTYVCVRADASEHPQLPLPSLQGEQMESQRLTGSDSLVGSVA